VSGLQPLWFHVCNVLLHVAASLLFTRVCLAVAGLQPNFAGAAGVLFAAHPIHTEAVSKIQYFDVIRMVWDSPNLPLH
jgi:hypothetical protein